MESRHRTTVVLGLVAACLLPTGATVQPVARAGATAPTVRFAGPAVGGRDGGPPGGAGNEAGADETGPPRGGNEAGAPPPGAGVPAPGARYSWPLRPAPAVLRAFQAPTHAYGPGHRGVDLAGRAGQPVLAARAGTVVFAGPVAGHGVVSVQHDDGLRTTYEPVAAAVPAGAVVRAGDVLGLLHPGHAGCPGAMVCLHWGVRRERLEYLDPLVLLGPTRVRLLPVPDPWPDGDPPAPDPP